MFAETSSIRLFPHYITKLLMLLKSYEKDAYRNLIHFARHQYLPFPNSRKIGWQKNAINSFASADRHSLLKNLLDVAWKQNKLATALSFTKIFSKFMTTEKDVRGAYVVLSQILCIFQFFSGITDTVLI